MGKVVPTPTLPLSRTVNPWTKFDPVVCSVIPVVVPLPLTVNPPYTLPVVPTPTLPPEKMPSKSAPDDIEGVVPVNFKALELAEMVNSCDRDNAPVYESESTSSESSTELAASSVEVTPPDLIVTSPEVTAKLVELKEATPLIVSVASIPATVKVPPKDTGEPETEIPVPAVAETVMEEFSSSELLTDPAGRITDPPETSKPPDKLTPEVTVKDDPIATLPEVVKVVRLVVVALSPARLDSPVTFNPDKAPKPVIDPPIPTFPVVDKVEE